MTLEQIANTNVEELCSCASKVSFLAPKLYRCDYKQKCIFQTTYFYKYCSKELDRINPKREVQYG